MSDVGWNFMMFSSPLCSYLLLYIDMIRDMIWPPCVLFPVPGGCERWGGGERDSDRLAYRTGTTPYFGVETMARCEKALMEQLLSPIFGQNSTVSCSLILWYSALWSGDCIGDSGLEPYFPSSPCLHFAISSTHPLSRTVL